MNPLQTLRVAIRALLRNKLRSFLTTLGIMIGVGAVIAMVAIGEGAKSMVEQAFASMGSNLIIIMPGATSRGGAFGGFGSMPTLTWDDVRAIQAEVPAARYVAVTLRSVVQIVAEDMNWSTHGRSARRPSTSRSATGPWRAAQNFTQSDLDGGTKVAVLGQTVVDKLFGPSFNPVGQTVRIKNMPFTVIGVLAKKGQSPNGQDYDDTVVVPQTTYQAKIQGGLQKYVTGVIMVSADASRRHRARAEADHRAAARSPPHPARRRRRLLDPRPDRDGGGARSRARRR